MATESLSRPHRELVDWIRTKGGSISESKLVAGKRKIKTVAEAEQTLNALEAAGYGTWRNVPPTSKGGRPTRKFVLSGVSVSETPPTPEEKEGFTDADGADNVKTGRKRVAL